MTEDFRRVEIEVEVGSLTPDQVQELLVEISNELLDPRSETSQKVADLGLSVRDMNVRQNSAFVLEGFLIAMAIKFAGGVATAGGVLFFNEVIKPRIVRNRADGVGQIRQATATQSDDQNR